MLQAATQTYQPNQCEQYGVHVSRPQSQPGFQGSWCLDGVDVAIQLASSILRKTRPLPPDKRPV